MGTMRYMKVLVGCIICSVALSLCLPLYAQNTPDSRSTLSGIEAVAIQVVPTPEEIAEKGISTTVLAVEVERALKTGGVPINYPVPPDTIAEGPYLLLEVVALLDSYIDQVVYTIRLEFIQAVVLERDSTMRAFGAPTWSVGGTGVYSRGWRQAIIDDVGAFTAQFVDAYLQANPPYKE